MAETAIEQAIVVYNSIRLYAFLGYKNAPADRLNQAHQGQAHQPLKWYLYEKARFGNVQYQTDNQFCSPL
jgi:hypothetical protein